MTRGAWGLLSSVVFYGGSMPEPVDRNAAVNRRRFLRRGAITAAVAASGAAVLSQQPAGAANDDALLVGTTNTGTANTTLNATGTNVIALETSSASGAQLRLAPNSIDVLNDTTHTFTEGSLIADSTNQSLWYTYASGSASTAGLYALNGVPVFVTLSTPQRVYDSRPGFPPTSGVPTGNLVKDPLFGNQERIITVVGTSGAFVTAVLMNVTVVHTNGVGFLAAFSAGTSYNGTSNINWFAQEQTVANTVVSAVNSSGQVTITGRRLCRHRLPHRPHRRVGHPVKPIYDERVLGDLSEPVARSSAAPPAAYAGYSQLVASLMDLDAAPGPVQPGDAARRITLERLAEGLGDLSR